MGRGISKPTIEILQGDFSLLYLVGYSPIALAKNAIGISIACEEYGASFFGNGADMDFVRFVKRTLGLFFQIIVILIICASITFVHNALVVTDENAHKSVNTVVDLSLIHI